MSELLSSAIAAVLVFALGVPLATLVAKAILVVRWRCDSDVRRHGLLPSFLLIVGPSLATVLWFVSAALHRSEPGESVGVCALDHAGLHACIDSLLLALLLSTVVATALTWRWRPAACGAGQKRVAPRYLGRLARLCRHDTRLGSVGVRVRPTGAAAYPICVSGFFRPSIEVSTALMDRVDDAALEAALLHEVAHIDGRDPLRYLLASLALALNPLGFLLRPDLRRWRASREAVCDLEAVRSSADPLSLAQALIEASRLSRPLRPLAVGLGGSAPGLLHLRVHLLLGYASKPLRLPRPSPRWLGAWAVLAVLLSPHVLGAWPLDGLHEAAERFLIALGLI